MIAKISGGHGLRGALEYDFSACKKTGQPRAELIAGTLQGTPRQICKQAAPLRVLRKISKPVWRASLNADPDDGIISSEKWTEICHDFLVGMGLNPAKTAWVAVRHTDHHDDSIPRDHVHLTVIRQQPNGSLFNVSNDVFRSKKVTEMLEIKHQLVSHDREPAARRAPTVAQKCAEKRTGKMTSKEKFQRDVDQIFLDEKNDLTYEKLREKLLEKGTGIRDSKTHKGRLQGFSYFDIKSGIAIPGSKLGSDYSLGMLARGLKYDQKDEPEGQSPAQPLKSSKVPETLKSYVLKNQHSTKQLHPLSAQIEDFKPAKLNLVPLQGLSIGPLSAAMLLVSGALINFGIEVIRRIVEFMRRLLSRLGFGMREAALQKYEHPSKVVICFDPYVADEKTLAVPAAVEDAVGQILHIVDALQNKDSSLLPAGEGREEVVAAMDAECTTRGVSSSTTKNDSDFGVNEVDLTKANTISPTPIPSNDDLLAALKEAVHAHQLATAKLAYAKIKDFIYFDMRPKAWAERDYAIEKLETIREKFKRWKAENLIFSNLPSKLKAEFAAEIQRLEGLVASRNAAVKLAEEADVEADRQYDALPAAVPSQQIIEAEKSTCQALKSAREVFQKQVLTTIKELKKNPMFGKKLIELEVLLIKNFAGFQVNGEIKKSDIDLLTKIQSELKMLHLQDQALYSSAAPIDTEQVDQERHR